MIERRIKELSFALEALSRVNSYNAMRMRDDVETLLDKAIETAKNWPPKAIEPNTAKDINDEITF